VTWASQFRAAITLAPQIDDEDMVVEEVSGTEAAW